MEGGDKHIGGQGGPRFHPNAEEQGKTVFSDRSKKNRARKGRKQKNVVGGTSLNFANDKRRFHGNEFKNSGKGQPVKDSFGTGNENDIISSGTKVLENDDLKDNLSHSVHNSGQAEAFNDKPSHSKEEASSVTPPLDLAEQYHMEGTNSSAALNITPEDEALGYPLEYTWTLWFDHTQNRGVVNQEWENNLFPVGEFGTITGFWEYWRGLSETSSFPVNSNLRLFKKGIRPAWEDPANAKGGQWMILVPPEYTTQVWNEVVMAVIGEQLEFSENVSGVVLALRPKGNRVSIWNRIGKDTTAVEVVLQQLKNMLAGMGDELKIEYKLNKIAIDFNKRYRQQHRPSKRKGKDRKIQENEVKTKYEPASEHQAHLTPTQTHNPTDKSVKEENEVVFSHNHPNHPIIDEFVEDEFEYADLETGSVFRRLVLVFAVLITAVGLAWLMGD